MKLKLFLLFFLLIFLQSCYSYIAKKTFKKEINTCYTGIKKKDMNCFETHGFYVFYQKGNFCFGSPNTENYKCYDSLPVNMFFFEDGICLCNFGVGGEYSDRIEEYFNSVYGTNADNVKYWQKLYWGIYNCTNDTIKAQFFFIGTLNAGWYGREEWFKIIDGQTLKSIYARPIGQGYHSQEVLEKKWYNRDRYSEARFTPLERMPSSDNWLKREKWFWCNEEDWKNYMDSVKTKRR